MKSKIWQPIRSLFHGDVKDQPAPTESAPLPPEIVAAVVPPQNRPPVESVPDRLPIGGGGLTVFDAPEALEINRARMDHLASLGLAIDGKSVLDVGCGVGHLSQFFADRGCRLFCVDARAENLERLAELYPGRPNGLANVEKDPLEQFGRFEIVFAYGLLYHTENPIAALRNMTSCCDEVFLLESVITDYPKPILRLADEPVVTKNQSASGFGCRPSPAFVAMALSRMGFRFVYTAKTPPRHEDFELEWRGDGEWQRDGHLLRCIFVASREKLENAELVPLLESEVLQ